MHPVTFLSVFSPLVPLLAGWKNRFTLLWFYCLTAFSFDVFTTGLKITGYSYKWPGNIFVLLELWLISHLFKKKLFKSGLVFYSLLIILSILFIGHTIHYGLYDGNRVFWTLFLFLYMLYCLGGFYVILRETQFIILEKNWFFWVCIAFLIYATGSFLVFLFLDYWNAKRFKSIVNIWVYVFSSLNIIKMTLLTVAIVLYKPVKNGSV